MFDCGLVTVSDVKIAAAGIALLEAEKDLAVDELTLLCEKFNLALDIPETVEVDDEAEGQAPQSQSQAADGEATSPESARDPAVETVATPAADIPANDAVIAEDEQVDEPLVDPEAPVPPVAARSAEYVVCV